MEENINLDHGDFMGVGAQHDAEEISPVEHELDPVQENMNLDTGSQHSFTDFMGVGAQHDDDMHYFQELDPAPKNTTLDLGFIPHSFKEIVMGLSGQHGDDIDVDDLTPQEPDPAPENINLDLGLKPYSFMDFMMSRRAQHGDDIDIDYLISQEPNPAQMHHHQRNATCSDVNDARLEDRVRLDLNMRLQPETSLRHLRQEGPQPVTLQLGPTTLDKALNPTSQPALDLTLNPESLDPVKAEFEGWAAWIQDPVTAEVAAQPAPT